MTDSMMPLKNYQVIERKVLSYSLSIKLYSLLNYRLNLHLVVALSWVGCGGALWLNSSVYISLLFNKVGRSVYTYNNCCQPWPLMVGIIEYILNKMSWGRCPVWKNCQHLILKRKELISRDLFRKLALSNRCIWLWLETHWFRPLVKACEQRNYTVLIDG